MHTGPAEMLVSSRESDTPPATVESIYLELVEFYLDQLDLLLALVNSHKPVTAKKIAKHSEAKSGGQWAGNPFCGALDIHLVNVSREAEESSEY